MSAQRIERDVNDDLISYSRLFITGFYYISRANIVFITITCFIIRSVGLRKYDAQCLHLNTRRYIAVVKYKYGKINNYYLHHLNYWVFNSLATTAVSELLSEPSSKETTSHYLSLQPTSTKFQGNFLRS